MLLLFILIYSSANLQTSQILLLWLKIVPTINIKHYILNELSMVWLMFHAPVAIHRQIAFDFDVTSERGILCQ